jgi:hypothetical protein
LISYYQLNENIKNRIKIIFILIIILINFYMDKRIPLDAHEKLEEIWKENSKEDFNK